MNQWNKPPIGSQIDFSHPLSRGLVGCWLMNEGSGNRICDLSGNGNHGVINGPLWHPRARGHALAFDGIDDYVSLPAACILAGNEITINISIKADIVKADTFLIFADAVGEVIKIYFFHSDGRTYWYCGGGGQIEFIRKTNPVELLGQFHNWTFWKNANTGLMKMFIDGKEWMSGSAKVMPITAPTAAAKLGNSSSGSAFQGDISHAIIYNRALSAAEILDLYINPYGFIRDPHKYWLMPQGGMIPPHLLFRRAA